MQDENTVLVAILNNKIDFEIAKTQLWYRIPFDSAPKIVKEKQLYQNLFGCTSPEN